MTAPVDTARRALLRGRLQPPPPAVRPPWALVEYAFVNACTRCGACIDACPERIMRAGDGSYPEVDFRAGGCTFCGACADTCPEPAFASRRDDDPWSHTVTVGDDCLASRGVFCMSCRDACDAGAIVFERRAGASMPAPDLDASRCTGCGKCIATCPVDAIDVVHPDLARAQAS